ncbi:hypothetical protein [Burkholderia sp. TSV86]|uniref:hypothetical protein n=1 Tax=Burkholderia sp. TSV86 TaxID=1385594 RepID=UPI0018D22C91|nr:hypothetical protein [Burkholderia sp. TSV86]
MLAAIAVLVSAPSAFACDIPARLQTIDPRGYHDDASGYADAVKPMRGFVSRPNTAAGEGDWPCASNLLDNWARADALMRRISDYQGYYERSWMGTDFAMVTCICRPAFATKTGRASQRSIHGSNESLPRRTLRHLPLRSQRRLASPFHTAIVRLDPFSRALACHSSLTA